jgi:hypothetical protein
MPTQLVPSVGLTFMELHGVGWYGLAQDRAQRKAFVNSVMNVRGPIKCR